MDEAARCTRVGFLRSGRLIREGTPGELRRLLAGRIAELAGEPQALLARTAAEDGDVEAVQRFGNRLHLRVRPGQGAAVVRRLPARIVAVGGRTESLQLVEPQLEDVFIALSEVSS
jgi:ABC-2 type transport system ATP-binding protein